MMPRQQDVVPQCLGDGGKIKLGTFSTFTISISTEKLMLKAKILPKILNLFLVAVSVASARDACSARGLLLSAQSGTWT